MTEAAHRSMLCVGGPHAGRRVESKPGAGFTVPVLKRPASTYPMALDPVEVEHFDYRAEVFHTPDGDVWFWAPRDQSALQTITLLLECYEQAHKP